MTTTTNAPYTTGDDLDDLLAENGGVGDFESDPGTGPVERWHFPRFAGAEKLGTCDNPAHGEEGTAHEFVEKGKSKCVDWSVDMGNMYLSRAGIGAHNDTDVETIVEWMAAPRNLVGCVLLLGDPGNGKTALIEAAATHAEVEVITMLCTPDHTKNDLLRTFVGEGHGECLNSDHGMGCGTGPNGFDERCNRSPFTYGPLAAAAKYGKWFYADEFMRLMDGVQPIFYSLADGRRFLPEGNPDGSPMEIHEDFRLILSSNPLVRGASLPEPLASRAASTTLHIETSAAMLRDLGIDESVVAAWEALKAQNLWAPAIRELRLADHWLNVDTSQAVSAFMPEHCPESQRKAVRDMVVSFLGGDIREDGRLVVS